MIVPPIHDSGRTKQFVSFGTTFFLVALGYTILALTPVPDLRSGRAAIRELDPLLLARYDPKPERATRPENVVKEPPELTTSEADVSQAEVERAMEQLAERFGASTEPILAPDASGNDGTPSSTRLESTRIGDRLADLFGETGQNDMSLVVPGRRTSPSDAALTLDASIRGSARVGGRTGAELGTELDEVAVERVDRSADLEVSRPTIEVLDHESDSFDDIDFDAFGVWMNEHPASLPPGVKVHLGFDPAFSTSIVKVNAGGTSTDLYLMYKEALRELHVVLVQGETSIYLIDRGFSETSHALREGVVTRDGEDIIAIDSQARPASSQRARDFYSIFLSWWDEIKSEIQ